MGAVNTGKTNPDALAAIDRALAALELRKRGHTYRFIAEKLGYASASGSHKAVTALLKQTIREASDELRELELERLDALLVGLWAKAKTGNVYAVDRVLKIGEARARLLGINAPTKIEHMGEGSPKSIAALIREEFGEKAAKVLIAQQPESQQEPGDASNDIADASE